LPSLGFAFLILTLLATSLVATPASADDTTAPTGNEAIRSAIRNNGEAQVILSLEAGSTGGVGGLFGRSIESFTDDLAIDVEAARAAISAQFDTVIRRNFQAIPATAVTVSSEAALDALLRLPGVASVSLDFGGSGALEETIPIIGADQRHAVGNGGAGVTIAVLDSGADSDHPDLVDDLLPIQACFGDNNGAIDGQGFCPNGSDRQQGIGSAEDDAGHGSHVTGIITSAGIVGSPGSAPDAEIISIKVTEATTFSGSFDFFSEILAALDWIIVNNDTLGVDIINMSLVTNATYVGDCDSALPAAADAFATLRSIGITPFASSGNNGGSRMTAPACFSDVISVGATDDADNVANFTDSNTSTDVMAPGRDVISSAIGGGLISASGTSFASPHAAGCAALLLEAGEATTPNAIEAALEASTVTVTDARGVNFPRIDCRPIAVPPTATAVPPTAVPPTATAVPPTSVPPTAVPPTAVPPTAVPPTAVPPTAVPPTAVPPTAVPPTAVPPTAVPPTSVPPTATAVAPTAVPPTATAVPPTVVAPTATPVPPTATHVPPTATIVPLRFSRYFRLRFEPSFRSFRDYRKFRSIW